MSYIGQSPVVGNFQICDAISTVNNQAAYTMQVGSANVSPESANHMIVSLNGVIQKPDSAYTISGATITFASNLVTGDVINFIQLLGDVLDIGTPSDGAVTTAKLASNSVTTAKITDSNVTGAKTNFVSTSSAAGLQIKGDGTTDGTLQLNCSQNTHGIKIKSPPHSASASYTLTMPNNDGDANQFLQTNGSGVLSFATIPAGGITVADMWRITADKSVGTSSNVIDSNLEQCDTGIQGTLGSAMSVSSGLFTFPSTGIWLILGNFKWNNASNNNSEYCQIKHETTSNNGSSYTDSAYTFAYFNSLSSQLYSNSTSMEMLDITNTSTHKIRFTAQSAQNSLLGGSTDHNTSTFTFIRMGDT